MGEARKDRQLRMDAVLLEIFLQALHTGYAVIAIRGVADKLVVELADTDEDGYLLYGFEVDIITEVILEITDTPEESSSGFRKVGRPGAPMEQAFRRSG